MSHKGRYKGLAPRKYFVEREICILWTPWHAMNSGQCMWAMSSFAYLQIALPWSHDFQAETTVYLDRLSIIYPPISDAFDNRVFFLHYWDRWFGTKMSWAASSFLSLQNLRSKQKKLSIEIDVYFDW